VGCDCRVDVIIDRVEGLNESLVSCAVIEKRFLDDFVVSDVVALVSGFSSSEYEHERVVANCQKCESSVLVEKPDVLGVRFDQLDFGEFGFFEVG